MITLHPTERTALFIDGANLYSPSVAWASRWTTSASWTCFRNGAG